MQHFHLDNNQLKLKLRRDKVIRHYLFFLWVDACSLT